MFTYATVILVFYFSVGWESVTSSCVTDSTRTVRCELIDSLDNFRENFQEEINRGDSSTIAAVRITNSDLSYIPHDFFKGLQISTLDIISSILTSLSDTDTAFEGLENSLKEFTLGYSVLYRDMDWSQLRNLKSLKMLKVENIGLEYVENDIKVLADIGLDELYLFDNRISFLSDEAFADFVDLEHLNLYGNSLTELKRSMFPKPGNKLSRFNLGFNKISSLPSDFFTNMQSLTFVVLTNNELLTLDQAVFSPIWKTIRSIFLSENPFTCDCRMKWLLNQPFPKYTLASCAEPPKLRGLDLMRLKDADLWCF